VSQKEFCEKIFAESRVVERAARSSLYRKKWADAGIVPEKVRAYDDLRKLPFTSGKDLQEAQEKFSPDELVCGNRPRLWVSTSGTTGAPKWYPLSDSDIRMMKESFTRLMPLVLGVEEGFSFLYVGAPAPFVSAAMGYFVLGGFILDDRQAELSFVSLEETMDGLQLARKAGTEGMFSFPSLALLIAENVRQKAAEVALNLFRKKPSVRHLFGLLATKLMTVKAKHAFRFRWGLFSGESLDPYRKALVEEYGLRPFACYGATEFVISPAAECRAQNGMHVFLDRCLPEIIPNEELEREENGLNYVPAAIPLWDAPAGLTGELVLTTYADALPLVRYRISDLIEVVGRGPCQCGHADPRIRVLHRSDDIVNMGLVRIPLPHLKEKLDEVGTHGKIDRWQLRVARERSKAKARLVVKPTGRVAEEAFREEIKSKLDEIGGIKQARESSLIAQPEVIIVEDYHEERTLPGKVKLVVYEDS
jgi:phenylacetate-coenzyme A ligase PaaK-like adenylate-forming protein